MLERIKKRDGSIEPFNPHKVNSWSQWATSGLGDRVDWSHIVLNTVKHLGPEVHSQELQKQLIKTCLEERSWPYNLMAGKLYNALYRKEVFGDKIPTIKELHAKLFEAGLIRQMKYTDEDYLILESIIDHTRDFNLAHFQVHQLRKKYSLRDLTGKVEYETPQFIFIRMAMALAEDEAPDVRFEHLKNWYDHFSFCRLNAPTPNYVNLGTHHNGYASCCVYTTDDNAASLAIGDHIAYTMTYMSAGIGAFINSRSINDSVRKGRIIHQGKLPYFKSLAGAVKANLQGGRGGACTSYFSCFDPEVMTMIMLQNPRTVRDKQNRDIHFAIMFNRFFAVKVAQNKDIFTFNKYTAPDLLDAFFSSDNELFERLYKKYEDDPMFNKTYISARSILFAAGQQSFDVATLYYFLIDEANRHTPFLDKIFSSNLCLEVSEPTAPYQSIEDLYSTEDHGRGEVALCSLAAIVEPNIKSDEEYASAAYYALKMIDKCIHMTTYVLPHIGVTAKNRLNAGVGIAGLATTMAKRNLTYDSKAGLEKIHQVSERHAYHLINQSLRLGKELGNAPWIHKTKWPQGWLPIDTYKKSVDELVEPKYRYDWEDLRARIIANGGIRNSTLINHMPTESSSKSSGVPNSIYPVRDLAMKKSDAHNLVDWCAVDGDIYGDQYQSAWSISQVDLIKAYAVVQKFTDQSISADGYKDRSVEINVTTDEIIQVFLAMVKYGVKSRYYQNSLTSSDKRLRTENITPILEDDDESANGKHECVGGCTL